MESDVLSSNPNTALFAVGRKKHKNDTIDRLAALWIRISPRLIVIGSRITARVADSIGVDTGCTPTDTSGLFWVTGENHTKAVIDYWKRVFAICIPPSSAEEVAHMLEDYPRDKWDWTKCVTFTRQMAMDYLETLKHTGTGKDGIHNYCYRYCGPFVVDLLFG